MLRTRIITAVVLLVALLGVVYANSFALFALVAALFFAAASWESLRLFRNMPPAAGTILWTVTFAVIVFKGDTGRSGYLFALCVALWLIRLGPSLAIGLPPVNSFSNRLLNGVYGIALLGCFVAIAVLFRRSPLYLLSVMAIVWVADIGAYAAGKAFGKHKLAPSISPGKSWEGAIGGWLAVMALSVGAALHPLLTDTFASRIYVRWGGLGLFGVISVLVVFSIAGDLFESQLKRRAGMKDSSNLLPGHGGVLDRIDALIPVLPLAALIDLWR